MTPAVSQREVAAPDAGVTQLSDCMWELRGRASPLTAGADGMSYSECIDRPMHAMRAIAGGGGALQARYSVVEEG